MKNVEAMLMKFVTWLILLYGSSVAAYKSAESSNFREARRLADTRDDSGFINIDCGNDKPNATLGYVSDASFTDSGISRHILTGDYEALDQVYRTVRSFPSTKRSCYSIRPSKGREYNYLIRARFLYGNYDGLNKPPVFDLYIGVDYWDRLNMTTDVRYQTFFEILHKPTTDNITICLVDIGQGTPFISVLLLRPVDSSIYSLELGSLNVIDRYYMDPTASIALGYLGVAGDPYDRFWSPQRSDRNWKIFSTGTSLLSTNNDKYEIPPRFFMAGASLYSNNGSMTLYVTPDDTTNKVVFYAYWHFAENLKLSKHEKREFTISTSVNSALGPFTPSYMKARTVASSSIRLRSGDTNFSFTISPTNVSTLPPILNAYEVYSVITLSGQATNENDVNAIMDIKANSGGLISGWQGDPCLPKYPWKGLTCSSDDASPRIISLDVSFKGLTGEIMPALSNLTSLNSLNLSYNGFTGRIPEFLATMPSLRVIDLRGNILSGSVPIKLMEKVNSQLLSLRLDGNPDLCTLSTCEQGSKGHKVVVLVAASASLLALLAAVIVFFVCRSKTKGGFPKRTASNVGMKSKNMKFTYSQVISVTNNFQTLIGKGAHGKVYHGLYDGTEVAVKILNPSSAVSLKLFQTEAELLMRVHHRNLVSLVGYCDEHDTMALIYEFMANSDVEAYISGVNTTTASWRNRLQISIDAAQGLEYLHNGCKPAIVHRDVKTANILVDDKLQAKVADFGISRIFSSESATHITTDNVAGTPGYLDPEYSVSGRLTEKSDVYSFGVILLELITGRTAIIRSEENMHITSWVEPFLERGQIHDIMDSRFRRDYSINSAWKALETAMACVPSMGIQRPSMTQVVVDLKECLALELAQEKAKKGVPDQEPAASLNLAFDNIEVDPEASSGPMAR